MFGFIPCLQDGRAVLLEVLWPAVLATANMMIGVGFFHTPAAAYMWSPTVMVSMMVIAGCCSSLVHALVLLSGRANIVHVMLA